MRVANQTEQWQVLWLIEWDVFWAVIEYARDNGAVNVICGR